MPNTSQDSIDLENVLHHIDSFKVPKMIKARTETMAETFATTFATIEERFETTSAKIAEVDTHCKEMDKKAKYLDQEENEHDTDVEQQKILLDGCRKVVDALEP